MLSDIPGWDLHYLLIISMITVVHVDAIIHQNNVTFWVYIKDNV